MTVRYISLEEVQRVIDGMGFKVRDRGLLDSALYRPRSGFGGVESYPTIELKAAALLQSLALNHALFDGNKRLAWVITETFLDLNQHGTALDDDQIVELMIGVVTRRGPLGGDDPIGAIAKALTIYTLQDLP